MWNEILLLNMHQSLHVHHPCFQVTYTTWEFFFSWNSESSFSSTVGYTRPAKSLHPMPPPNRLITIPVLLSILGVQITNAAFLLGSLLFVQRQSWFHSRDEYEAVENENYSSYENTVLFIVSSFQYIAFAFIYAKGYPYRRNFYTNSKLDACRSLLLWTFN